MKYYRTQRSKKLHIMKENGRTACCVPTVPPRAKFISDPGDRIVCKWCILTHYRQLILKRYECRECGKEFFQQPINRRATCSDKCKQKRLKAQKHRKVYKGRKSSTPAWSQAANKQHRQAEFKKHQAKMKCRADDDSEECLHFGKCLDRFICNNMIGCIKG